MAALTEETASTCSALIVNDVLDYLPASAQARCRTGPRPGVADEDLLRSVCDFLSPGLTKKDIEIGWAADAGLDADPVSADEEIAANCHRSC